MKTKNLLIPITIFFHNTENGIFYRAVDLDYSGKELKKAFFVIANSHYSNESIIQMIIPKDGNTCSFFGDSDDATVLCFAVSFTDLYVNVNDEADRCLQTLLATKNNDLRFTFDHATEDAWYYRVEERA